MTETVRILAVDVGGGTQDILIYDSSRTIENCVKLVLPSQTQVVARRIARATAERRPLHLAGCLMGGGASSNAVELHLAEGLPVSAQPEAARTLHNNLDRVRSLGIEIVDDPPDGATVVHFSDIDLDGIHQTLDRFEIDIPEIFSIAVQDHGYVPGERGRAYRSKYLRGLIENDGDALNMIFREPPEPMIRMRTVAEQVPGAFVMDTGAAAVLGILGDPVVAEHALGDDGAVLINVGNLHTFAIAFRGSRVFGLFEHHTGGVTPEWLSGLVRQLQDGTLTHADVMEQGGHGAAFSSDFPDAGGFQFVAITGPNRHIADPLGYYQAVPYGDMMLSGPYGLVRATLSALSSEGRDVPALPR
ncbi:MAG: DUF1786 domain-containing protein [Thermomicrobiales bacterium]